MEADEEVRKGEVSYPWTQKGKIRFEHKDNLLRSQNHKILIDISINPPQTKKPHITQTTNYYFTKQKPPLNKNSLKTSTKPLQNHKLQPIKLPRNTYHVFLFLCIGSLVSVGLSQGRTLTWGIIHVILSKQNGFKANKNGLRAEEEDPSSIKKPKQRGR